MTTKPRSRPHPQHDEILRLLTEGLSAAEVARRLRADRASVRAIRRAAGLPAFEKPPPPTLEEKWQARVRPLDGGHLEWLGERARGATPVMRFQGKSVSPLAIAFRMRTGREPVGQVRAECDVPYCVAPGCVEDEPGRLRIREQLRYLKGTAERSPFCARGHDQAVHGRYEPDGTAYCHECKVTQRGAARATVAERSS
ncbi:hypothetical protein ACIP5N_34040 [Streptomyces sp. NPDC088768]|uniref:hypothetical protein n=1 Tax=Streptomyces sp. NPDC088768 TaxID=3365894 RepID=UPI0037FD078C